MTRTTSGRLRRSPGLGLIVLFATAGVAHGVTVLKNVPFPADANVLVATPDQAQGEYETAIQSLSQTFQVDTAFDLESVYLAYGNTSGAEVDVALEIFRVADYASLTLPATPDPGDVLLSTSFTTPTGGNGSTLELTLDSLLNLPVSIGSEGYALRFSNTVSNEFSDAFTWPRTASSAGSTYSFGQAFEDGVAYHDGERDFALALLSPPPVPALIDSVMSGDLNSGSTWSSGAPPTAGVGAPNQYRVLDGHTVTATSAAFDGDALVVVSGGTLDLAVTSVTIPTYEIEVGGVVQSTFSGFFEVGDISNGIDDIPDMNLDGAANFVAAPGASLYLDVKLTGEGELNFEGGAGSNLVLTQTERFDGDIRFNGAGDDVVLETKDNFVRSSTIEMNSTGANRLLYDMTGNLEGGTFVFNQPGTIDHASTTKRYLSPGILEVNAPVTVDISAAPPGNERRFHAQGTIRGSGDIFVVGTPTDTTSGGITRNEFEVGGTNESSSTISYYTGTITTSDYVDVEIRKHMRRAAIVINDKGTLEMGFRQIDSEFDIEIGEVTIGAGGTLNVGYEADGEHVPSGLLLTNSEGRSGTLTLEDGSTTRLQISGIGENDFDTIAAEGDIHLDGVLELLVNPPVPSQTDTVTEGPYAPLLGETFDIISIVEEDNPADFNSSGLVDGGDRFSWERSFGLSADADADGDGDSDGLDFLAWQRGYTSGGELTGAIVGTYDSLSINDPEGVMASAGLAFQINYVSPYLVQLEVVSAASAAASVPEPGTLALSVSLAGLGLVRRRARKAGRPT